MALDEKTFFYLIVAADASVLKAAFMSGANETGTGRRGTAGGQSDTCHTGCMALQWRGGGWGVLEGGEALETPPHQPLPRPHSRPHQLAPYHYHHRHRQPQYVISFVCVMVDLEVGY